MKRAVIRLPESVAARLAELARELNAAYPGRRFSKAAVARVLLSMGLTMVDAQGARFGGVRVLARGGRLPRRRRRGTKSP